jgi:hypothetical protein
MTSLEERVKTLEQLLMVVISNMGETRKAISDGFTKTNGNFTKIHEKIDTLTGNTNRGFQDVTLDLANIQDEISKINSVTGYEEAINNMHAVKGGKS